MEFLGENIVDVSKTEWKNFTPANWAMMFIERYGQIDGDHHKTWVLDQVSRILNGTPIIVSLAKWEGGQEEYRFKTGTPSLEYLMWVEEMRFPDGGDEEYGYEEGIAP